MLNETGIFVMEVVLCASVPVVVWLGLDVLDTWSHIGDTIRNRRRR